jgi:hypothetical protein
MNANAHVDQTPSTVRSLLLAATLMLASLTVTSLTMLSTLLG